MSAGQNWGFNSIGAIATKKPFGSEAVQLTFPAVFAETFAIAERSRKGYIDGEGRGVSDMTQGDDFQSSYHEQKHRDAVYMANAKVDSTRRMNARAFSSHNGYFGMPSPVLGQRTFANPSQGAQSVYSARQDYRDAPFNYEGVGYGGKLEGGVLRTAEGQGYAKSVLMNRIAQFNAIDSNVGNFTPDPRGLVSQPTSTTESLARIQPTADVNSKIELKQLLQGINDSLNESTEEISSFTYKDTTRALALVFRLVPEMEDYEVSDLMSMVSDILNKLNSVVADPDETAETNYDIALSLTGLFQKIHDYLHLFSQELAKGTRTEQERVQISKTLVQTLGFAKFMNKVPSEIKKEAVGTILKGLVKEAKKARQKGESLVPYVEEIRRYKDPQLRYATQDATSTARFSKLAPTRESQRAIESAARSGLGTFDVDNRGAFGNNAGHFYRTEGREVGYVENEDGIDGRPEAPITEAEGIEQARITTTPAAKIEKEEVVPNVRGRYDEDTQGFNVETTQPKTTTRLTDFFAMPREGTRARAEIEDMESPFVSSQEWKAIAERQKRDGVRDPVWRGSFPRTREEFDALAKINNALPIGQRWTKDGRSIQVFSTSSVASIRKNFQRRFRRE